MIQLPEKGKEIPLAEVKKLCLELGLLELLKKIEHDPPKKLFKSDGCSYWPDRWKDNNGKKIDLYIACLKHDLDYWGGYPKEIMARFIADARLMIDVGIITKRTGLAVLMFLGVRIGGVYCFSKRSDFSKKNCISKRIYFKTSCKWGAGYER